MGISTFFCLLIIISAAVILYVVISFGQVSKSTNPVRSNTPATPHTPNLPETERNDKRIFIAGTTPEVVIRQLQNLSLYDIDPYTFELEVRSVSLARQPLTILTFPENIPFELFALLVKAISYDITGSQTRGWSTLPVAYKGIENEATMIYLNRDTLFVVTDKQNKYSFQSSLISGATNGTLTPERNNTENYIQAPLSIEAVKQHPILTNIRMHFDGSQ